MRKWFQKTVVSLLLVTFFFASTGCGTILHPERKGQTRGRIDPAIAILDGIGLLFYIVPGVIAYAIDFSNGTIYLPKDSVEGDSGHDTKREEEEENDDEDDETNKVKEAFRQPFDEDRFTTIHADPEKLDRERMESLIRKHTGTRINLNRSTVKVRRSTNLPEEPRETVKRLITESTSASR